MFSALEFLTLNDEWHDDPVAGIRFWDRKNADDEKTTFVEFYESDGVTKYRIEGDDIEQIEGKRSYAVNMRPATETVKSILQYPRLPVVPLFANAERKSELTRPIKSKIDLLDKLWTNFGDSSSRINMIYWILHNYSVTPSEAREMIETITELGIFSSQDDKFKAEAKAFDLPSETVDKAIEMVEKAVTADFLGVSMREITGGSLTNVAINTAYSNLMNKIARYETMPFAFVQQLMNVIGLQPTENISFKYETPRNQMEETNMVMAAANYLDEQTILDKLPFVTVDEVEFILERRAAETLGIGEYNEPGADSSGVANGQGDE